MSKQIIGLGGGGFTSGQSPLLDLYIIASSPKPNPKICLLPTASADNGAYSEYFEETFNNYPCKPTHLNIFNPRIRDMEEYLLDCDIIYVGGGNSKSMLGLWREWGIDKILTKAYENGVVLAGVSAGFVCWFEQCITDSIPNKYTAMSCLGLLQGAGCPHYGPARQQAYHSLLKRNLALPGYAAEDEVGLHFIDGKFLRSVSADSEACAYHVNKDENNEVIEQKIIPEYLNDQENLKKYILNVLFNDRKQEETVINDPIHFS